MCEEGPVSERKREDQNDGEKASEKHRKSDFFFSCEQSSLMITSHYSRIVSIERKLFDMEVAVTNKQEKHKAAYAVLTL